MYVCTSTYGYHLSVAHLIVGEMVGLHTHNDGVGLTISIAFRWLSLSKIYEQMPEGV